MNFDASTFPDKKICHIIEDNKKIIINYKKSKISTKKTKVANRRIVQQFSCEWLQT